MSKDKTETSQGGEGDREADRRYRKDARKFVEEGRVEEAADNARDMTDEEKRESVNAEEIGKSRARGRTPGNAPKPR